MEGMKHSEGGVEKGDSEQTNGMHPRGEPAALIA